MVGQGKSCRILYSNIRGLHSNLNDLAVASRDCDIILCAETLVSDRRHVCEVEMSRFLKPALIYRGAFPGAQGMALYIRKNFSAYRQSKFECRCHEVMVVRVCSRLVNFYIFGVYRNPNNDDSIYDCLLNAMASIQSVDRKASFLFVGDLNAHHVEWLKSRSATDRHGAAAYDFAGAAGCEQLVDVPTHRAGNCLDLVLTNVPALVNIDVLCPVGTSDHSCLSLTLKLSQSVPSFHIVKEVFLKGRVNWDRIRRDVANLDWKMVLGGAQPIMALNDALRVILRRHVPVVKLKIRSSDKPWFDSSCKIAYDRKQTAYHSWSRHRSVEHWNNFVDLRTQAERVYQTAINRHNSRIRNSLGEVGKPHKWWTTLKTATLGTESSVPPLISASGLLVTQPKDKADLLMGVFDAKQSRNEIVLPSTCHPEPRFGAFAFKSSLILTFLKELDSHGGTDPVGFFPLFYKEIAPVLAPKLSVIFRKLLRLGLFPDCWKTANITPVPKGPISQTPSNYRPISITPALSKVFEKLIASRLGRFCESQGLFPANQFAYRKGLGTCDCLLSLTHRLQSALDAGEESRMVLIDFSAAFDRVNHRGLVHKLKALGIGGGLLSVITNFLSGRVQRVVVDGCFSSYVDVVSGVPQGSVLGPLLFILYTADLFSVVENELFNYADDSTLVARVRSPSNRCLVAASLDRDLVRIRNWCNDWDMLLNGSKTKTVVVSRSRTVYPEHPALTVGDCVLKESGSVVILGVTFDSKLTFEKHIRTIVSAASQKLGIVRKASSVFGDNAVSSTCFRGFVMPLLEYCAPVWGSAAVSHLNLLDRIVRMGDGLCGIRNLDLSHRRIVGSLSLLYKINGNTAHSLHSSLPLPFCAVRETRATTLLHMWAFELSRCRTFQFARCFIPNTVKLWNSLPASIFAADSLNCFKSRVNRFLLVP